MVAVISLCDNANIKQFIEQREERLMIKDTGRYIVFIVVLAALCSFSFVQRNAVAADDELTMAEAKTVLEKLAPNVEIIAVERAAVKGWWQVAAKAGGQKTVLYVDDSRQFVFVGNLLNITTRENLTKIKFDEINKVDVSTVPLKGSVILGDKKADHKIFVFTDPDCPYCAKIHPELKKVVEQRKDIAFYLKLYPLPMHPKAYDKSKTIVCEKNNDNALKLLEEAYAKKEIPAPSCETTIVDDNKKLASQLGITGTPTIILQDGRLVSGALQADNLIDMIDKSK